MYLKSLDVIRQDKIEGTCIIQEMICCPSKQTLTVFFDRKKIKSHFLNKLLNIF